MKLIYQIMKENKDITCDPCQENFKHSIDQLVHEVRKPSVATHQRRGEEVRSVFGHHKAKEMHDPGGEGNRQAVKPASKSAVMPEKKR